MNQRITDEMIIEAALEIYDEYEVSMEEAVDMVLEGKLPAPQHALARAGSTFGNVAHRINEAGHNASVSVNRKIQAGAEKTANYGSRLGAKAARMMGKDEGAGAKAGYKAGNFAGQHALAIAGAGAAAYLLAKHNSKAARQKRADAKAAKLAKKEAKKAAKLAKQQERAAKKEAKRANK